MATKATFSTAKPTTTRVARGVRRGALGNAVRSRRLPGAVVVCSSAAEPAAGVVVKINIHAELGFGNSLAVVGAAAAFGAWAPENAMPLSWTEGNVWAGEVALPAGGAAVEFKLIAVTPEVGGRRYKLNIADS